MELIDKLLLFLGMWPCLYFGYLGVRALVLLAVAASALKSDR